MLKQDKGITTIKGSDCMIKAELSTLINSIYTKEIMSKEEILRVVKQGFMTEDKLQDKINNLMEGNIDELEQLNSRLDALMELMNMNKKLDDFKSKYIDSIDDDIDDDDE